MLLARHKCDLIPDCSVLGSHAPWRARPDRTRNPRPNELGNYKRQLFPDASEFKRYALWVGTVNRCSPLLFCPGKVPTIPRSHNIRRYSVPGTHTYSFRGCLVDREYLPNLMDVALTFSTLDSNAHWYRRPSPFCLLVPFGSPDPRARAFLSPGQGTWRALGQPFR